MSASMVRNMQQFIMEDHLDGILSESRGKMVDVLHVGRDEFTEIMLRKHQAHSSRK